MISTRNPFQKYGTDHDHDARVLRWRAIGTWLALCVSLLMCAPTLVSAQSTPDQLLFGPQPYLRTTDAPNEYTATITAPASVGAPFLLHIVNGQSNGQNRISSA